MERQADTERFNLVQLVTDIGQTLLKSSEIQLCSEGPEEVCRSILSYYVDSQSFEKENVNFASPYVTKLF